MDILGLFFFENEVRQSNLLASKFL